MSIPGSASPLFLSAAAAAAPAGDEIERSLRFNSNDSANLSKNFASAGNRKTWTWSCWFKASEFNDDDPQFFTSYTDGSNRSGIFLDSSEGYRLSYYSRVGGTTQIDIETDAVIRDYSAWYHFVIAVDTTQSTSSDRVKVYINGVLQSLNVATYPSQNYDTYINANINHYVARYPGTPNYYLDGYLADVHFIDGQALAPTDFGEPDDNGVWQPKAYSGTYGTNGFHLDFSDNTSTTTIAEDSSGNNNDWTANNLSVASGAGNDSLVDSPTNGTQEDTGVGGEVVGNYATLNALNKGSGITLKDGNLGLTASSHSNVLSTIAVTAGMKTYMETTVITDGVNGWGLTINPQAESTYSTVAGKWWVYDNGTNFSINTETVNAPYGVRVNAGDVLQLAIDYDSGKAFVGINNTWINSTNGTDGNPSTGANPTFTFTTSDLIFPLVHLQNGELASNFGQRPFAYTAPSGFKALCTANLPDPTIADGSTAMDVETYTGNGSTQTISGLNFSPDLVWLKKRGGTADLRAHQLFDIVRGTNKALYSNLTDAEFTDTDALTAFNSDGFTLGAEAGINTLNDSLAAWTWDAGTSTVSNTDGSITSSVRANASAGFSIVSWTGTGSAGSIGHGLNTAPALYIIKNRDSSSNWMVKTTIVDGSLDYLYLNLTNAKANSSITAPTSSVINLGVGITDENASGANYITYCFAPVAGYSAFGSYTGNGSADGPFVFTGFRPRWLLLKRSSSTSNWIIWDSARNSYNILNNVLEPDTTDAEADISPRFDVNSNGFKLRSTTFPNDSGVTFIYAAFAEHPLKHARAR